jgi:hypothetical protein
VNEQDLINQREISIANSSAISYLQVGRPELLHIVPSDLIG